MTGQEHFNVHHDKRPGTKGPEHFNVHHETHQGFSKTS